MALHRLLILFVDSDPGSLPLFEEAIGAKFSEPAFVKRQRQRIPFVCRDARLHYC